MTAQARASIQRILAPTDFGPASHAAVMYAAGLALDLGAWLTILHVLSSPNQMIGIVPGASVGEELDTARAIAEDLMTPLETDVRALGFARVVTMVDASLAPPARAILVRAASEHADLIVMATHGRSGVPRMVLGSVADVVIRTAACPVLTFRPH